MSIKRQISIIQDMKVNSKSQVKVLLTYEGVQLKELAYMMCDKSEKKYTPDGLSHKINRGTLSYDEMLLIAEILGYEISFKKIEN